MTCRRTTPAGDAHEHHLGVVIAPGVIVDPHGAPGHVSLCVHADPEGDDQPIVAREVPLDVFHPSLFVAKAARAVKSVKPASKRKAPRRR